MQREKLTQVQQLIFDRIVAGRGKTVSRDAIVYAVYKSLGKEEPRNAEKQIDVFIHRIRKKGYHIETVWGEGFRTDLDPKLEEIRRYEEAIHFIRVHYPEAYHAVSAMVPQENSFEIEFHDNPQERDGVQGADFVCGPD